MSEDLNQFVIEHMFVPGKFPTGLEGLEAKHRLGPRQKVVFRFQLIDFAPHHHACLLDGLVDGIPIRKKGAGIGPQGGFMFYELHIRFCFH